MFKQKKEQPQERKQRNDTGKKETKKERTK